MMTMNRQKTPRVVANPERTNFTKLAVAAIDFGTTYSGFAYSFRSDYQSDPLKVNIRALFFRRSKAY